MRDDSKDAMHDYRDRLYAERMQIRLPPLPPTHSPARLGRDYLSGRRSGRREWPGTPPAVARLGPRRASGDGDGGGAG